MTRRLLFATAALAALGLGAAAHPRSSQPPMDEELAAASARVDALMRVKLPELAARAAATRLASR